MFKSDRAGRASGPLTEENARAVAEAILEDWRLKDFVEHVTENLAAATTSERTSYSGSSRNGPIAAVCFVRSACHD